MTYKPKLPDETVNVSEANMGIYGLKVIGGFVLCIVAIYIVLAVFSDYLVRFVPVETENKLYSQFDSLKSIDDQAADKYQKYADQLLAKIPQSIWPEGYDLSISVMDEKDVNAFAMPGGHIILTSALMDEIKTENGLIFVIGHEIGHYYGRDHLKGISRQILMQVMAAVVLGQSSADLSGLDGLVNMSVDGHYSRRDESNADEWGLKILMATYGHVGGATEFLNNIMDEDRGGRMGEMFSTHPLSEKRINAIEDIIARENYPEKQARQKNLRFP